MTQYQDTLEAKMAATVTVHSSVHIEGDAHIEARDVMLDNGAIYALGIGKYGETVLYFYDMSNVDKMIAQLVAIRNDMTNKNVKALDR